MSTVLEAFEAIALGPMFTMLTINVSSSSTIVSLTMVILAQARRLVAVRVRLA